MVFFGYSMKITIVGAGNAGCFTALHYAWYSRHDESIEIELRHDPSVSPEPVGQATSLEAPHLLWGATDFNWYNNKIHATFKSGILYENWGKYNDKLFHPFSADLMAMHYCPNEMQSLILNSKRFTVIEEDVSSLDDIDSDYIFDCRGKPKDYENYHKLINPINAAILGKPNWDLSSTHWSRHVATPDGWTFVIPTHPSSPSHNFCVGYCYNQDITSQETAENNFQNLFDVEVKKHLKFKNYVAKNPIVDDRILLSGNRLFFLEPLESSSTQTYQQWARFTYDAIVDKKHSLNDACIFISQYIQHVQNFVLWHYKFGSAYSTPFWDYASSLVSTDPVLEQYIDTAEKYTFEDLIPEHYGGRIPNHFSYAQWHIMSIKNWYDGMTKLM